MNEFFPGSDYGEIHLLPPETYEPAMRIVQTDRALDPNLAVQVVSVECLDEKGTILFGDPATDLAAQIWHSVRELHEEFPDGIIQVTYLEDDALRYLREWSVEELDEFIEPVFGEPGYLE